MTAPSSQAPIRGVWSAALTPLEADGRVAHDLLAKHCRDLFARGCSGIALFGTTGEGQSFSVAERKDALERLLAAGISPAQVVVGTGCAALPDTAELTRHAAGLGVAGVLVLPPFFWRNPGEDGVYASYAKLVELLGGVKTQMILYHIPQVTGVAVPPAVVGRLARAFPGLIAGVKDSSGDWDNTVALLKTAPGLSILVGHEPYLPAALKAGAVGTICGLGNYRPELIRRLHDSAGKPEEGTLVEVVKKLVALVTGVPFVPAIKSLMAAETGEGRWLNVRAPLLPPAEAEKRRLLAAARGFDAEAKAAA
ncbi:MAG: dihydrodipicolinate synthase family protein [Alphaproteobacteria bacterium]|nr:dihydrodipicolinate synthase family protein [Alphaproteobacteria bacterium]